MIQKAFVNIPQNPLLLVMNLAGVRGCGAGFVSVARRRGLLSSVHSAVLRALSRLLSLLCLRRRRLVTSFACTG
jgi:hypothetical protein